MTTWQWVAIGLGAWWLMNPKRKYGPGEDFNLKGSSPPSTGGDQSTQETAQFTAELPGGITIMADLPLVPMAPPSPLLRYDGLTAYDDAAGQAALQAAADAGRTDPAPQQPEQFSGKISPYGGGQYGVVPPRINDPVNPAFNSSSFTTQVATRSLSPRIGMVGR